MFESEFFFENLNDYDTYILLNSGEQISSKSKMISCFKTEHYAYNEKVMCLYRDPEYRLMIIVYDSNLGNANSTLLNYTGNKEEDDDIFFKGILYEEEIGIFVYYKNFSGTNPIFAMKINTEIEIEVEVEKHSFGIGYLNEGIENLTNINEVDDTDNEEVEWTIIYRMEDYGNVGCVEINGDDFSRHYLLNDIAQQRMA